MLFTGLSPSERVAQLFPLLGKRHLWVGGSVRGGLRGVRPLTPEPVLVRLPSHWLEFQQRSVSMGCFLLQGTSPNSKRIKEYKGHGMFTGARAGRYPRVRPGTKGQTECDPCTQWSAASLREEGNSDTCSNTDGPRGHKVMRFHFCVVTGAVRLIGEKADGAGARAGGRGSQCLAGTRFQLCGMTVLWVDVVMAAPV